ncbi:MAG: Zn-dependent hydrolase [Gammaproteobacteria bacterium]|nr:Zn-dependent hydrolase [Gammaproteobacteria bacterium]
MPKPNPSRIRVNGGRLWDSIMRIAQIGPGAEGGSSRLALSDEDKQARDLFVAWCREADCRVTVDDMGNIFARREGCAPQLPPVLAGSHLDTQPHGGKFDGIYGVLAALEVVRALNDCGQETKAPLEIVVWTNEEGCRFAPAMLASGVFAGLFDKQFAWSRVDAGGRTVLEELQRIDYFGDQSCGAHPIGALFEAHIEQGPILERDRDTIGVVTGAQGLRWYDIQVRGRDSHAGSTPMPGRRDALAAAAELVLAVQDMARRHAPDAVGTVGELSVSPNSRNTIPGGADFTVDLRHPDDHTLAALDAELRKQCAEVAARCEVQVEVADIWHNPPLRFNPSCVDAVRAAAANLQYRHQDMVSGAGHDACQVARIAPTAMIFVPCAGGVSHNEHESAEADDLEAGCNVLLHAMLETAGRA